MESLWRAFTKPELLQALQHTRFKTPKAPDHLNRAQLFDRLRQRIERRPFPFTQMPPELRKMVYDHPFENGTAVTFEPTPAFATTCTEARTHYFDNTIFCLATNRSDQSSGRNISSLRPTTVHETSKKFIRYLDQAKTVHRIKRVVITRDARYGNGDSHIFFAWLIVFKDGLRNADICGLGEFHEASGGKGAGFTQEGGQSRIDWSAALQPGDVFARLVSEGEVALSAEVLMEVMKSIAGAH